MPITVSKVIAPNLLCPTHLDGMGIADVGHLVNEGPYVLPKYIDRDADANFATLPASHRIARKSPGVPQSANEVEPGPASAGHAPDL
jgi:hypothetical protein